MKCIKNECQGVNVQGGICPGVSVQGVHVRWYFVLSPYSFQQILLNAAIQTETFKKKPFYICFVEFTKPFDYVSRLHYIINSYKGVLTGNSLNSL